MFPALLTTGLFALSAMAGRRLFAENLAQWQWVAAALAGVGVVLAALG